MSCVVVDCFFFPHCCVIFHCMNEPYLIYLFYCCFFFINLFILFTYFWLRWVFIAARGLSLVVVSGGYSSLRCMAFSLPWLLLLQSTGSRAHGLQQLQHMGSVVVARRLQSTGSVVVAHELSCSVACGIFRDQGSNPCPLHWQADSQPLRHQGSPGT